MTVADAGPLITFTRIGRIDLPVSLFSTIDIPDVVAAEIAPTLPGLPRWIVTRRIGADVVLPNGLGALHPGERAAIALALALGPEWFLADDLRARRAAAKIGLAVLGSVGIVLRAKEYGLIEAARSTLDALVSVGLYIDARIYWRALEAASEEPADTKSD